jgi:hypothetical protein
LSIEKHERSPGDRTGIYLYWLPTASGRAYNHDEGGDAHVESLKGQRVTTSGCWPGWVARRTGIGSAGRLRGLAGLALILRGESRSIIAGLAGVAAAYVTANRRGAPAAA